MYFAFELEAPVLVDEVVVVELSLMALILFLVFVAVFLFWLWMAPVSEVLTKKTVDAEMLPVEKLWEFGLFWILFDSLDIHYDDNFL